MKTDPNVVASLGSTPHSGKAPAIVVVGGAGFIGSNLAESFLREGRRVVILDNLSRPGVVENLRWLQERYGDLVSPVVEDIRDAKAIAPVFRKAGAVFHFAAQTAVTTSLARPVDDFEVNALGTVNVLEAIRTVAPDAPIIFASTNKVYGNLSGLEVVRRAERYEPADQAVASHGIGEDQKLDFCTPYGCSKGVADQYVLDYAKSYGLRTAVLRMSCIYGPRQFGTEDQGWVAHFLIKALRNEPISIYGDGRQVRDILHVRDAVSAYRCLLDHIDAAQGQAYNLGGGPANAVSILAVLREIEQLLGRHLSVDYNEWRAGDQVYFVADTRRLQRTLGWTSTITWRDGLRDLHDWLAEIDARRLSDLRRRMTA
jgi:CDP-paratose 2-epimerase